MLLSSLVVLQLEVISYCYDYNQLIHSNDKDISEFNHWYNYFYQNIQSLLRWCTNSMVISNCLTVLNKFTSHCMKGILLGRCQL